MPLNIGGIDEISEALRKAKTVLFDQLSLPVYRQVEPGKDIHPGDESLPIAIAAMLSGHAAQKDTDLRLVASLTKVRSRGSFNIGFILAYRWLYRMHPTIGAS